MSVTTLVAAGDDVSITGDPDARYPIYSVTKTVVAAAVLLLVREGAVELDSVRSLLDHTSGVARLRLAPRVPRGRADAAGIRVGRRRVPRPRGRGRAALRARGSAGRTRTPATCCCAGCSTSTAGSRRSCRGSASARSTVAERLDDLVAAVPAPSELLLDGVDDVRGVYDPRWVGHRTLVARAEDLVGFWRDLPAEMLDPATFVPIGFDAPGFVRPCYGLGVMADPGSPLGTVVGPRRRRPRLCGGRLRGAQRRRRRDRPRGRRVAFRRNRPRSSCSRRPSAVAAKAARSTNPFNPVQRGRKGVG